MTFDRYVQLERSWQNINLIGIFKTIEKDIKIQFLAHFDRM